MIISCILGFMDSNSYPMHSRIHVGGGGGRIRLDCKHSSQIVLDLEVMQPRVGSCSHSQTCGTTSSDAGLSATASGT